MKETGNYAGPDKSGIFNMHFVKVLRWIRHSRRGIALETHKQTVVLVVDEVMLQPRLLDGRRHRHGGIVLANFALPLSFLAGRWSKVGL